jgi:hypothetical protein
MFVNPLRTFQTNPTLDQDHCGRDLMDADPRGRVETARLELAFKKPEVGSR